MVPELLFSPPLNMMHLFYLFLHGKLEHKDIYDHTKPKIVSKMQYNQLVQSSPQICCEDGHVGAACREES